MCVLLQGAFAGSMWIFAGVTKSMKQASWNQQHMHLKIGRAEFIFQPWIFRGYVSFREGI